MMICFWSRRLCQKIFLSKGFLVISRYWVLCCQMASFLTSCLTMWIYWIGIFRWKKALRPICGNGSKDSLWQDYWNLRYMADEMIFQIVLIRIYIHLFANAHLILYGKRNMTFCMQPACTSSAQRRTYRPIAFAIGTLFRRILSAKADWKAVPYGNDGV